jgi:hypothetical protein
LVWSIIFVLVALQMTTALRPILGTSETLLPTEKKFFLRHWVDCADGTTRETPLDPAGQEMRRYD